MFPYFNMHYQHYFWAPNSNVSFSPFFNDLNQAFILPTSHLNNGQNMQGTVQNQSLVIEAPQLNQNSVVQNLQVRQNKDIKNLQKEKLIRKLANRPATYLTERKFYLSQKKPEENHFCRKLRQRNSKTRPKKAEQEIVQANKDAASATVNAVQEIDKISVPKEQESVFFKIQQVCQKQIMNLMNQKRPGDGLKNEKVTQINFQSEAKN